MKQKTIYAKKFVDETESFADSVANESNSLRWSAGQLSKRAMKLLNALKDETADEEKSVTIYET